QVLAKTGAIETASIALSIDDIKSITAMHPWIDRQSKIVFADYVTADSGTGIVHTAPGHGTEDFQTGQKYGLEVLSPVDDKGCYTSEVPEWEGTMVFDANPLIVEFLKNKGRLYHTENINHSYPHDWRTKTPVMFRAKAQWFYRVAEKDLTAKTLEYLPKIKWTPAWGEGRISNMLKDRPDWCVSRQRKWGVPIIAFYCTTCNHPLITEELCESVARRVETEGLDFWFDTPASDLLPNGTKCQCGCSDFTKEEDILDVWFDSGSSHYAVLTKRGMSNPADLYLEGSDQYRGWFQSSLWNSMGINGQPPFKAVCSHGWVLDENGRQMHKSAGNSVSPSEVYDKFGADVLRLWVVTEDFTKDLRIGSNIIQKTVDLYRKLRNTFRYLLGSLDGFNNPLPYDQLLPNDRYVLYRLAEVRAEYEKYMEDLSFHRAYREIFNFAIIDLSGQYFDYLKDRLYILNTSDPARLSAQSALFYILQNLTAMSSPALVFTMEEVYQHAPFTHKKESVHLEELPIIPHEWKNEELAKDMAVLLDVRSQTLEVLQRLRDEGQIGSALDANVKIASPQAEILNKYADSLKEMLIVSQLEITMAEGLSISAEQASGHKCARCWRWETTLNDDSLCPRCMKALAQ
ncbi:MAG: isoleucine--tRNA ligase, partial [Brevinema sp.]